jgi:Arylsulfotransferase (ASST)
MKRIEFLVFSLSFILLYASSTSQNTLLKYTARVYDSVQGKGYYFLFTYKMRKRDAPGYGQQMIMDGTGHTIYYRIVPKASDFKLHPDGRMSYFGNDKFMIMDASFRIMDSVTCVNGIEIDNHDFVILPNGHYLLIGTKNRMANLSAYKIFMQKGMAGSKKAILKYGVVQELDKNKKLIYQWDSEPYFKIENAQKVYLSDTTNLDVTHFNSVDKDLDGNLIISARYSNEIIKVNYNTGVIMWRLGGKYNHFKCLNDSMPFLGQHEARILPNGHLLLFDNGYGEDAFKHNARALEYELDTVNKVSKLVWFYQNENKIISEATGNAQRLSNGNTLINYGKIENGKPNITFEEVNMSKQKIFSLSFADTVGSYRAFHYPSLPFKLRQPKLRIKKKGTDYYLEVKKKYKSYLWSTGATDEQIKITQAATYYVYVPYGDGGNISSVPIVITEKLLSKMK